MRREWGVSVTPRPLFTPWKDPVPTVQVGWAPGPGWTGAENLAPTGIRSPDRPARSQSLHRLRYPGYNVYKKHLMKSYEEFGTGFHLTWGVCDYHYHLWPSATGASRSRDVHLVTKQFYGDDVQFPSCAKRDRQTDCTTCIRHLLCCHQTIHSSQCKRECDNSQ